MWGLLSHPNLNFSGTLKAFDTTLQLGSQEWLNTCRSWYGKRIGYIFQDPMTALNPTKTCGFQLKEAILTPVNSKEEKAVQALKEVGLDASALKKYPFQLSGGQQQRVMIAMALINSPELIVADEPNTALDTESSQQMVALLRQLQVQRNATLLFVSHDFRLVADIADSIAVMQHGEVVEMAPADRILHNPQHPYTKALLKSRPRPEEKAYLLPEVSDWLEGKSTQQPLPKKQEANSPIAVSNLVGGYYHKSTFTQVAGPVTLDFNRYHTIGIVGKSGSGKSTLAKTLVGALKGKQGEIVIGNQRWELPLQHWKELRSKIQYVFQDPYGSLNPSLSLGSQLCQPFVNNGLGTQKQAQEKALTLLQTVGLQSTDYHKYPHEFSGGQRQRLVICRALMVSPQLLVCDESVSALDVSVQAKILNLLHQLQAELQLKILFISHDPDVVAYFCEEVIVLPATDT